MKQIRWANGYWRSFDPRSYSTLALFASQADAERGFPQLRLTPDGDMVRA